MKQILIILAMLLCCSTAHAELWGGGSASTLIVQDAGDEDATYYLLLMQAIDGALVGKTDGGITYNPNTNAFIVNGTLSVPKLFNTAGDLDIQPNVQGDVHLFRETDVGDESAGNSLIIWRRAVEGDVLFNLFVSASKQGNIACTDAFRFSSEGTLDFTTSVGNIEFNAFNNVIFDFGNQAFFRLVDKIGAAKVQIQDSDLVTVAFIDSTGKGSFKSAVIGDGTNETQIDGTGKFTLAGTARVIKHLHFTMELGKGQSAPAERFDEEPYVSYTYGINDDSHLSREAPGNMDYTADSIIKVHWYTTDATAGGADEVRWEVQWASRAVGEDITAGDTTGNSGDIVCSAQNIIVETSVITIAGNSIAANDMIGIHVKRVILGDGTNPQASTIHIIDVELQYILNKLGEAL